MFKPFASILALGLIALAPASPALDEPAARWSPRTADSVAARHSSEPAAARGGDGAGYRSGADAVLDRFTIRLSGSGESIRGHVAAAAADARAASGLVLDVAPGTVAFDDTPPEREIHVTVTEHSPCGPLGGRTVGCGGYMYRDHNGRKTVVAGVVWIAPGLEARGGTMLRDTVLHELGHALGLDHYDEAHHGQHQVMRSVVSESFGGYRPGDRAGLADLARGR